MELGRDLGIIQRHVCITARGARRVFDAAAIFQDHTYLSPAFIRADPGHFFIVDQSCRLTDAQDVRITQRLGIQLSSADLPAYNHRGHRKGDGIGILILILRRMLFILSCWVRRCEKTPYLNYLRSFEAAARHLSFTIAADELNYTQSAISNHVRSLEKFVGRPLFVRYPRSLALTTLGKAYLPIVRHALKDIDDSTEKLITTLHEKKVTIACSVSLAQYWLAGVVVDFNVSHPDIAVSIHGKIHSEDEAKFVDINLIAARSDESPESSLRLWSEKLTVVCAPDYTVEDKPLRNPVDTRKAHLIHVLGRPMYWQQYAELFGIDDWSMTGGSQTNSLNVALELAARGQGCAILPKSLIGTYLRRGLLVEPFDFDLKSAWSLYISQLGPGASKPAQELHRWLMQYQAG